MVAEVGFVCWRKGKLFAEEQQRGRYPCLARTRPSRGWHERRTPTRCLEKATCRPSYLKLKPYLPKNWVTLPMNLSVTTAWGSPWRGSCQVPSLVWLTPRRIAICHRTRTHDPGLPRFDNTSLCTPPWPVYGRFFHKTGLRQLVNACRMKKTLIDQLPGGAVQSRIRKYQFIRVASYQHHKAILKPQVVSIPWPKQDSVVATGPADTRSNGFVACIVTLKRKSL